MQTLVLADIPPTPPKGGCDASFGSGGPALLVLALALLAGRALRRRRA